MLQAPVPSWYIKNKKQRNLYFVAREEKKLLNSSVDITKTKTNSGGDILKS